MNSCAHRRRASQAIALNIAEGNGKATSGDRRRSFESARGSALECAAIQDVLAGVRSGCGSADAVRDTHRGCGSVRFGCGSGHPSGVAPIGRC
ncbi:MAG: four helix bundle protein [Thiohalocapsa sp. PB-PSB1]|nr:MAG: four helix bundle protein [Thiohalocapsa sp. PB-PSB1]